MHFAILLISLAMLAGCITTGDTHKDAPAVSGQTKAAYDSLPKQYSPSNQAIGVEGDIANYRAMEYGLVDIPLLEKYLNDIFLRIKQEAKLSDVPGRVLIPASDKRNIEASADGNIYFNVGMLREINTEDEVVALLAHEFAHVAFSDHNSEVWGNYQKQIQTSYAIGAKILANAKTGQADAAIGKRQNSNLQKLQWAIGLTDKLAHPAWKRYQEQRADRFAIDMQVRLGYSFARGTKSILERFAGLQEIESKKSEEAFQKLTNEQLKAGDIENLLQTVVGKAVETVSVTHDAGSARIQDAISYYELLYDDLPRPTPKTREWKKIIEAKSVKAVLDNYLLAYEAFLATPIDPQKGIKLAKQATRPPTQNHPYTFMALVNAEFASGDQQRFQQSVIQAKTFKEPIWELYMLQANDERNNGRTERAEQIMEEGYLRFNSAPNLRPTMIEFYTSTGKKEKAEKIALDCNFKTPVQRDKCMQAGGHLNTNTQRGKRS